MENKFTDSEIMKALECCSTYTSVSDCKQCPLRDTCEQNTLDTFALDLINRQKAEIERLQKENSILSRNADTAFQDGLNEAQELYQEQIKSEIKRQAISDFVEAFEGRCISGGIYPAFIKNQLYAVKGDMTEGDKL